MTSGAWLLAIVLSLSAAVQAEEIVLGYFEVPPHVMHDTQANRPTGALVEFFEQHIAPQMGVTVTWVSKPLPIPRQLIQLKKQQLDGGLIFAKNPEREKFLRYPKHAFMVTRPALLMLRTQPLEHVQRVEDLVDLQIGYAKKAFVSPFMRDERIRLDLISSPTPFKQNFGKLLKGRIDAMYAPEAPPLLYLVKNNGAEDQVKIVYLPEHTPIYTAFSQQKGHLTDRYDKAFEAVGGVDAYLKILAKYIDINRL